MPSLTRPSTRSEQDILGGMSMVFWAITLVVLIKYVFIVLQANDHGEGKREPGPVPLPQCEPGAG